MFFCLFVFFFFCFCVWFFFKFVHIQTKKKVLNIGKEQNKTKQNKTNKQTNKFAKIYKYFMKKNKLSRYVYMSGSHFLGKSIYVIERCFFLFVCLFVCFFFFSWMSVLRFKILNHYILPSLFLKILPITKCSFWR